MDKPKIVDYVYFRPMLKIRNKIREYRAQDIPVLEICELLNLDIKEYKRIAYFCKSIHEVLECKTNDFKKRNGNYPKKDFTYIDIVNKFGPYPICYLTGEKILYRDCEFDHIIPSSRGGSNELDNLGITGHRENHMKRDLFLDEFFDTMIKILEYNKFSVPKISNSDSVFCDYI